MRGGNPSYSPHCFIRVDTTKIYIEPGTCRGEQVHAILRGSDSGQTMDLTWRVVGLFDGFEWAKTLNLARWEFVLGLAKAFVRDSAKEYADGSVVYTKEGDAKIPFVPQKHVGTHKLFVSGTRGETLMSMNCSTNVDSDVDITFFGNTAEFIAAVRSVAGDIPRGSPFNVDKQRLAAMKDDDVTKALEIMLDVEFFPSEHEFQGSNSVLQNGTVVPLMTPRTWDLAQARLMREAVPETDSVPYMEVDMFANGRAEDRSAVDPTAVLFQGDDDESLGESLKATDGYYTRPSFMYSAAPDAPVGVNNDDGRDGDDDRDDDRDGDRDGARSDWSDGSDWDDEAAATTELGARTPKTPRRPLSRLGFLGIANEPGSPAGRSEHGTPRARSGARGPFGWGGPGSPETRPATPQAPRKYDETSRNFRTPDRRLVDTSKTLKNKEVVQNSVRALLMVALENLGFSLEYLDSERHGKCPTNAARAGKLAKYAGRVAESLDDANEILSVHSKAVFEYDSWWRDVGSSRSEPERLREAFHCEDDRVWAGSLGECVKNTHRRKVKEMAELIGRNVKTLNTLAPARGGAGRGKNSTWSAIFGLGLVTVACAFVPH